MKPDIAAIPVPEVPPPADVVVLVAHPTLEQSRVNLRLMQAAEVAGARVEVRDLYALYPDYLIDVAAERAAIEHASLVVWQHPIHWYSMPPLMKLWLDDVLAFGWAYGPDGGALRDKALWLVATTGGPEESYRPESYNRYFFDAFLPPYEQTAALCGMRFLPPMVLHGAHRLLPDQLETHAAAYARRLATFPDWPEIEDMPECIDCVVPADVRPAERNAA